MLHATSSLWRYVASAAKCGAMTDVLHTERQACTTLQTRLTLCCTDRKGPALGHSRESSAVDRAGTISRALRFLCHLARLELANGHTL